MLQLLTTFSKLNLKIVPEMMKSKYRYNTDTLKYERVVLTRKDKLNKITKHLSILASLAILVNIGIYKSGNYPKLVKLENTNNKLSDQFIQLNQKINSFKAKLSEIQENDDNLYRPLYEIEPVSPSVRMAGFGGSYTYQSLEGYKSSPLMIGVFKNIDNVESKVYVQSKSYDQVISQVLDKENYYECRPGIKPISDDDYVRISDYFGLRKDPFSGKRSKHYGIDFAGPRGGKIYATGKGVVTKASYTLHGYGRVIIIDHGYGIKTRYAHLDKILVKVGDKVNRGDNIGLLGNSGRSTGAHLHYEVRVNNKPQNPLYFINHDLSPEEYDKMIAINQKK